MTIESPLALSTRPTERSEKMYREGVAYASPCHTTVPAQVHNTPCLPVSFPKGVNQPDTPEQYMQDPCLTVASPSSVLMYEQDVSDMQKSLLSPGSNHGNLAESFQTYGISQGRLSDIQHNIDDVEQSFNLESVMGDINSLESSKVLPWSPQVLDTGQTQFKVEDVMISHNVNEGPTLAELNKMDSAIFDDISNMITNDSVHVVKAPVSVTATETQESKKVLSNVKDSAVKQQDCNMVASASTAVVDSRPVVSTATVSRFTTCTITSPTQTIKTESVSPSFAPPIISIYNTPTPALQHHTHLPSNPTFYAVPFAPAPNFLSVTTTTVQQPSLQNLLASPVHNIKQEAVPGNRREVETNVVKSEAVSKQLDSPESGNSNSSINTKWEEIKRYLEAEQATTDPPVKRIKTEPSDAVYKPEDVSQEMNSDSDSDFDFSDTESIGSHCSFVEELLVGGKKEKRYFWQYNTQAKGPKGKRLCKTVDPNDPHVLNDFEDPVFDPDITDAKYKHNGRARKGDGNDITPSPYKLYQIGNQLNKLNKKINEMAPSGETSVPTRNKTRREKNKYASRACRLKKKAQHEANKIKLYGLDTEHTQLMMVLDLIRTEIHDQIKSGKKDQESLTSKLEKLIKSHLTAMIAGNTAEYVNCVLEHVVNGDKTGGLNLHSQP